MKEEIKNEKKKKQKKVKEKMLNPRKTNF